jgi:hypothetical protein
LQVGLGRLYTISFAAVSCTVAQDLFYCKPAADKPCVLEAAYVSNVGGTADAGDAQEELLRLEIIRLPTTVTVGSGGTAPTIVPININDTAGSFAQRANDTTVATTSGTSATLHADGWNVRSGFPWTPPPEHRFPVANASALVIRLNTAPNDAILLSGTAYFRELI